ncbi:S-methylmethionine-dependent homocysteine/selenocysteine methylase [Dysgonomonas alginatilytica]|uniref:S-methylmethionine-dependent homocysteine/selenocysteine methylase n=1 Tax=Dysgonomonas alginatilytica TaxID=1605892 RepID=A0A2V3PPM2_9BACT|nr:homocysteine S-methyltransferase family protein [Dysgonomonas alginatilytica]PXV65069.1 S-methylmethionine-dependent homocysteine/selenocysteine methylase [Dysgonomonas alginatilytica]
MDFLTCYTNKSPLLMEGALGERLKREYNLSFDADVAMASLIYTNEGRQALTYLWNEYIAIAEKHNLPFIATTPTRRANKERVNQSKYSEDIISENVSFLRSIKASSSTTMFTGGLMGCKGDAYQAKDMLSIEKAKKFHSWQANLFHESKVDFLFAAIMPALSEAIGMAKALEETHLPYIISFMILENGCLIDGTSIHDAIMLIDKSTQQKPVCYMANCVHPKILYSALEKEFNQTPLVKERFGGIQANTSPLSPEELDNSADLKCSDSIELANEIIKLNEFINLNIVGGCCGTDNTHIEQIAKRISNKQMIFEKKSNK